MFVLFAFLLLSCAFFAQDLKAQSEGTLLIAPRLDLDPAWNSGGNWSFDLGSTSLYTLFEGNIGERVSFSVSNHWFAFTSEWSDCTNLYRNTWRADEANWVDWANITLNLGNFFITAGKDYINMATDEINADDYDSHWQMNSMLWNTYQVYQWGGKFGWMSHDESTSVSLQMTTDMTMNRPFETRSLHRYAYTLNLSQEWESVSAMASVTHSDWLGWLGTIGTKFSFSENLSLGLDAYLNKDYYAGALRFDAALSDKFEIAGKLGYEWFEALDLMDFEDMSSRGRLYGGVLCNWYPLNDSHDLRVHMMAAPSVTSCRSGCIVRAISDLYFSAGATYFFEFKLF